MEDIRDLQHRLDDLIQIGDADVCPQDGSEPRLSCLTVRFPTEGLFAQGEAEILPGFRRTLDEFFPQYLQVLQDWAREDEGRAIREVRIEGHSSSEWERDVSDADAFFFNMALSQGRTRSVLEHIYGIARERSDGDLTTMGQGESARRRLLVVAARHMCWTGESTSVPTGAVPCSNQSGGCVPKTRLD